MLAASWWAGDKPGDEKLDGACAGLDAMKQACDTGSERRAEAKASPPTVTVVALAFMHESWIEQALKSVVEQVGVQFDIVLVDDCSTDNTFGVAQSALSDADVRVTLLRNEENLGVPRALNRALDYATGDYIALISCDDWWDPGHLAGLVGRLSTEPSSVGMVYGNARLVDVAGHPMGRKVTDPVSAVSFVAPSPGALREVIERKNLVPIATLIRRSVFRVIGSFDPDLWAEEPDIHLRIASRFGIVFEDSTTVNYRQHGRSMSATMTARRVESRCRTYAKWILFDDQVDQAVAARLHQGAQQLYRLGERSAARRYLRLALGLHATPSSVWTAVSIWTHRSPRVVELPDLARKRVRRMVAG